MDGRTFRATRSGCARAVLGLCSGCARVVYYESYATVQRDWNVSRIEGAAGRTMVQPFLRNKQIKLRSISHIVEKIVKAIPSVLIVDEMDSSGNCHQLAAF